MMFLCEKRKNTIDTEKKSVTYDSLNQNNGFFPDVDNSKWRNINTITKNDRKYRKDSWWRLKSETDEFVLDTKNSHAYGHSLEKTL